MNILMISMDKTLIGEKGSGGDTIKRHQNYGRFCNELDIIVFSKKKYRQEQLSNNVFVYPTNSKTRYHYFLDAYKIGKRIYQNNPYQLAIGDLFTGLPAYFLKRKFKIKFLMHFHSDFWNNIRGLEKKWHNYFLLFLSKFLVKKADGIRVVCTDLKNKLIRTGVPENKIRVIPTPVDLNKFLTYDANRVYELETRYKKNSKETENINIHQMTTKIILFVGRLEKVKNLEWFLKVFKKIVTDNKEKELTIKFLIIGQGSLINNLIKKSQQLGLENLVKFIGLVDYEELTNYYHLADVVVLPSISESFGNVLVQAGATGRPCIATETTGAKEIIKSFNQVQDVSFNQVQNLSTGFLVPINNQKQMIEKIMILLKDEKLCQEIGEKAKEYVKKNFDGEVNTQKIVGFWQEIINDQ